MDHDKIRASVMTRTAALRDEAGTDAEVTARDFDIVDLIVNGASLRQCAKHYGIDLNTARAAYARGLAALVDSSIDRSIALREEVTARQRELILANMARAKAGDKSSAMIVQNADSLLASIWGLRSLRIEPPARPRDPAIADALDAYLRGITEGSSAPRS